MSAAISYLVFAAAAITAAYGCDEGWDFVADKCFMLTKDEMTHDDADKFCTLQGGKLPVIRDEDKLDALVEHFGLTGTAIDNQAWVGATFVTNGDETVIWNDSTEAEETELWGEDQPNPNKKLKLTDPQCIKIKDGGLNDQVCSVKRHALCEVGCAEGELMVEGECYTYSDDSATWEVAADNCESGLGQLAIVRDDATLEGLVEGFGLTGNDISNQGWVGAHFVPKDQSITWLDDVNEQTELWGPDQPNPAKKLKETDPQCIKIKDGGLNDQDCTVERKYICQMKPGVQLTGLVQILD